MDHSHMDHGGMDMSAYRCNMNVRLSSSLRLIEGRKKLTALSIADALHLEHREPLHRLSLVAHQWHSLPDLLSPRSRRPRRCIRSAALCIPPLRDVRGQEVGRATQ